MKKHLLFLLTTIVSLNCYSQISFEKGYFIDNDNQKVNCLIKNIDWRNNPTEFEYKLSENGESKKTSIKSIKEFGINNVSKYVRSTVKIDRSSDNVNYLSHLKNPIFKEEELFLKVLVEGKASLYQYIDKNLIRYFYNKEGSDIEQLIFKRYKTTEKKVSHNNRFRQQLWVDLNCPNFKMSKIENVDYKKHDLVRFFTEYSECHNNNELIDFESKQKRDLINLTIRPRINNSSLTIQNSLTNGRDTDFDNKTRFGIGLEAEFILPFNKNKWAIAIEPTYQSFKSEKTINANGLPGEIAFANVDYTSVELPVSLRHYFFLNNNSKIFVNVSFIADLTSNSSIEFTSTNGSKLNLFEIETGNNLAMGIGYKLKDRYSLEIRYQTGRDILRKYRYWDTEYKTISIIFGYSLF